MKLLVSDFDGTFYLDDINIKKNIGAVNNFRKNNNLFMLSSGRSFKSLKAMCLKYNIKYDYLSCCDGSILYDKFDNIVVSYNLDINILNKFLSLTKLCEIEKIQYSYKDDYYNTLNSNDLIGCNIVIQNEKINNKFLDKFYKLEKTYQEYDFLVYKHDDVTYFCLKNKGINKSSTIYYLKEKCNLDNKDIYTVGDNDNDYPMLLKFNGYYIGNPSDKIKDVCIKGYNFVFELIEDTQNDYNL